MLHSGKRALLLGDDEAHSGLATKPPALLLANQSFQRPRLMKKNDVPQDEVSTYAGQHKLLYAVDENGEYTGVRSSGWDVECAATQDALRAISEDRQTAWERGKRGETSPLEFHMYDRRMDLALLAQTTGMFQWRIRRHFRPRVFGKLSASVLARYCEALGLSPRQLQNLPETRPSD